MEKSYNNQVVSSNKFIPFFLLEIIITTTVGSMGTAMSNYLISELNYAPWVGGLIISMTAAGFLIFTLAFGHISDKYGQKNVIIIILIVRLLFSIFYLIPITSNLHLFVFGVIFFLDGGVNGLFWPTIQQISVLTENFGGLKLKRKYLSGYNFSWNFGFIFGMLGGAIIVFLFISNYYVLYLNTIALILGVIISIFFVKDISTIFSANQHFIEPTGFEKEYQKDEKNHMGKNLSELPIYSLLLLLLIHSLTDGVITIFLTLKIDLINQGLYWVFIITLIKLFMQMIATIVFSLTKESYLSKGLFISLSMVILTWFFILLSNDLWSLSLFFLISGFGQGIIYSLIMKLISYKAKIRESAKPFSYFQAMMSSGRMIGSLIFGLTTAIFLNLGIILLIIYDIAALIQFTLLNKNSRGKENEKTHIT